MSSSPIIHSAGRANLDAAYFEIVFRGKSCTGCGDPKPVMRVQTFTAIADLKSDTVREGVTLMVKAGVFKAVPLKDGPGIRTGEVYACRGCRLEAERAAARGPSYAVVVFDRMPGAEGLIVPVHLR